MRGRDSLTLLLTKIHSLFGTQTHFGHKHKYTGSKPVCTLFRVDLHEYMETIQTSVIRAVNLWVNSDSIHDSQASDSIHDS